MKFKANTRRQPIEYEKDLIKYWRDNEIFEKSVQMRPAADSYVFYDGPPFITGVPHHGTLLSSIVKDAVPRYQTMKGKRVERVWGWDCHGLPAEVFTEQSWVSLTSAISVPKSAWKNTSSYLPRKYGPDRQRLGRYHRPDRPLGGF
jgi:isoleucyl-tRNA synthetase